MSGYVWRAAKVFYAQEQQRAAFTRERLLRLLQGEVRSVITGLRHMATRRRLTGKDRKEIATVRKLAAAVDADETELLLLAKKVPPLIRDRVLERPDAYC